MKITTVTVSSGRKIPHPAIDFANLNSYISLTATLEDGDIAILEAEKLQVLADAVVEVHIGELRQRNTPQARPLKAAEATANTAAKLAAKHKETLQ